MLCLFKLILLFIIKGQPSHPTYCSVLVCKLTEQMYKTNSLCGLKGSPTCYCEKTHKFLPLFDYCYVIFFCYKHFVYNEGQIKLLLYLRNGLYFIPKKWNSTHWDLKWKLLQSPTSLEALAMKNVIKSFSSLIFYHTWCHFALNR